jgi:hypothetical protein
VRLLSLVLVASFAAAGCGLESGGLGDGDDGGGTVAEAAPSPFDGTVVEDGSGSADGPVGDATGVGDGHADAKAADSGADSGVDSGFDTGVPDTGVPDTGVPDTGTDAGNDGGSDTGTDATPDAGTDSGADAADACGAIEICNNGIDDNCDGKIDCADPQCSPAWTCTPAAVPAGWSIVEYTANLRPACSADYGSPTDVVEGPAGDPATCGCACNVTTPGSCEEGAFAVSAGASGCTIGPVSSQGNGGTCSPATVNYTPPPGAKMQASALPYTAGSCTPNPTVTLPPVTFTGQGRVCGSAVAAGAGCSGGASCAPIAQGSGFNLCVAHDGVQTCPPGFAKSHTVGPSVSDTRGCSKCACGGATGTCQNSTLTLFPDSNCQDGGAVVAADGKCSSFPAPNGGGPAPTYVAYTYTAEVQGEACPPSAVSPDGTVSLAQPKTICCQ